MTNPSTSADLSGNNNTLFFSPAISIPPPLTFQQSGPFGDIGYSLYVGPGAGAFAEVLNNTGAFDVTEFTCEALVNGDNLGGGFNALGEIISERVGTPDTRFIFGVQYSAHVYQIRIASNNSNVFNIGATFSESSWHHIAVTYANGTWTPYVDGVAGTPHTSAPLNTGVSLQPITFGGDIIGSFQNFQGGIAAAAFYTHTLTAGSLGAHVTAAAVSSATYKSSVLADSPFGFWMFGAGNPSATKNAQWTVGEIAMSDFSAPNVANMSSGWQLKAFRNSNYGLLIMPNDGTGSPNGPTLTRKPGSQLLLYRIDADPSSATGYKINFFPQSLVTGWCDFVSASIGGGNFAWFQAVFPQFALDDSTFLFFREAHLSGGEWAVHVLKRNSDNTLTFTGPQCWTTALSSGNSTSGPYMVRTGSDTFARGYTDPTDGAKVEGIQVIGTTASIISSSSGNSASGISYTNIQYDAVHGYLWGWDARSGGSDIVWARPWGPGSGFTSSSATEVTLNFFPNGTIRSIDGTGFGAWTSSASSGLKDTGTYFDGSSWNITTLQNYAQWPLFGANIIGNLVSSPTWYTDYGDYLVVAFNNQNTTNFRIEYSRTGQNTDGSFALSSQGITPITFTNYGFNFAATGFQSDNRIARHSQTLCCGIFELSKNGGSNFTYNMFAFDTP